MKKVTVETREVVMDAVDAFDRLFAMTHRTSSLEGELPMRAVQSCPPMLEGTAAGFQIVAPRPILVDRDASGRARVGMRDAMLSRVARQDERVDRLVDLGLLARDGAWHRLLRDRLFWEEGDTVHLWTGHLVRPRGDHVLYLTTSFNRRSAAILDDRLYEADAWIPLVLGIHVPRATPSALWLRGDIGCLLPIARGATFAKHDLGRVRELGDQFNTFYDGYWKEPRRPDRYVRLVRGEPMDGPAAATCDVGFLGRDVYDVEPLAAVASPDGPETTPGTIPCAVVRNLCAVTGSWDGHFLMLRRGPMKKQISAFKESWAKLYGEEEASRLTSLTTYAFAPEPGRREILLRPWAFVRTPPGWSLVVDAAQLPGIQGFRGVLSTDAHHSPPLVARVTLPGDFTIPKDARVARLLPIPRRLLRTTFELRRLSDLNVAPPAALASASL